MPLEFLGGVFYSLTPSSLIPILVRNETHPILGSPPSQPSPIKGKGVLSVDLIKYHFKL